MLHFDELLQKLYEKNVYKYPMRVKKSSMLVKHRKRKGKNVEIVAITGIIWAYEITDVSALSQHENWLELKIDTIMSAERCYCLMNSKYNFSGIVMVTSRCETILRRAVKTRTV